MNFFIFDTGDFARDVAKSVGIADIQLTEGTSFQPDSVVFYFQGGADVVKTVSAVGILNQREARLVHVAKMENFIMKKLGHERYTCLQVPEVDFENVAKAIRFFVNPEVNVEQKLETRNLV